MPLPGVSFKAIPKQMFFNRSAIADRLSKAERKLLPRLGAYSRRVAQQSMRYKRWPKNRRQSSPPGQPPYAKQGDLRRYLYFAYEPHRHAVVVGPLAFGASTVPGLHEHGLVRRPYKSVKAAKYPRRPYMAPAQQVTIKELPRMVKGIIGG